MTATLGPNQTDLNEESVNRFDQRVQAQLGSHLVGLSLDTFQVNIGLRCNLACRHCHVESSPTRSEQMSWETMETVLDAARHAGATTLDITGGAPEMHPHFESFVAAAIQQELHVIVRTNLTLLLQTDFEHLPRFMAEQGVHLVASLPCYQEENVDKQRGKQVFRDSIDVLQQLNRLGYGHDTRLQLDLVYNPGGPSLPPPQDSLEQAYRADLISRFDIHFNQLYAITNMMIGRFRLDLIRSGDADRYAQTLHDAFNGATLPELMCRHQIHVGWDGTLYDCDFNYAINLPVRGAVRNIRDFDLNRFRTRRIATDDHCLGCTAGSGSSCQGSLTETMSNPKEGVS